MVNFLQPQGETEAQAFFQEVYPSPVILILVLGFLAGDVGVTIAAIVALG
jgi:hypothetical protein